MRSRNSISRILPITFALLGLLAAAFVCPAAAADEYLYAGQKKCVMCHKGEKRGMQKEKWMESGHFRAFETLKTDQAKKAAEEAGLTADPTEAPECLKCHTTGYGLDAARFQKGFVKDDGVTCEACHGPGSGYWKPAVMKDHAKSVAAGLTEITEETCTICHKAEGNAHFKGFNYEEALQKIAHPIPEG